MLLNFVVRSTAYNNAGKCSYKRQIRKLRALQLGNSLRSPLIARKEDRIQQATPCHTHSQGPIHPMTKQTILQLWQRHPRRGSKHLLLVYALCAVYRVNHCPRQKTARTAGSSNQPRRCAGGFVGKRLFEGFVEGEVEPCAESITG